MSAARMHASHRHKRQNFGNSVQGHHSTANQSIGLGSMMTEESPCLSGPIFTGGPSRVMNHGSRPDSRNMAYNGFEPGSSSTARFIASEANQSAVSSGLQHPVINSGGSATNSSHAYGGNQNQNTHKRKSPMDAFPGSLTQTASSGTVESNYLRFIQGSGSQLSEGSFRSIGHELGARRREGQDTYYLRNDAVLSNRYDGLTTTQTHDNFYNSSVVQDERAFLAPTRRMLPIRDNFNESLGIMGIGLPETFPSRQGIGSTAAGSWGRSSAYLEEGTNQLGFFDSMRNNFSSDGDYLRQGQQVADMMNITSANSRPHQLPNRAIRAARDISSSHLSHHQATNPYAYVGTANIQPPPFPATQPSSIYSNSLSQALFPPSGSTTALSSMASGPQAAFGDLSAVSMPGQFLPSYYDTSRALHPRQVAFRGSRVFPADGISRPRYSTSHQDFSNQSLLYEWVDAPDQHSNMRLDVDNMSYEELLALEERIGNVNTGVTEDNVVTCLKISSYACKEATTSGVDSEESETKCSVCQEEYVGGDELGELKCGHLYHTDCIKQWLLQKNQCPICKAAAC